VATPIHATTRARGRRGPRDQRGCRDMRPRPSPFVAAWIERRHRPWVLQSRRAASVQRQLDDLPQGPHEQEQRMPWAVAGGQAADRGERRVRIVAACRPRSTANMMPSRKPKKSPTRLTMNAFLPPRRRRPLGTEADQEGYRAETDRLPETSSSRKLPASTPPSSSKTRKGSGRRSSAGSRRRRAYSRSNTVDEHAGPPVTTSSMSR